MENGNLLRFYIKRLLSILPLYYATAIIYIFSIGEESAIDNLYLTPIEALGLQSTFSSLFGISHNDGTWFVSCILLAYIIYPLLHSVVKQLKMNPKLILLLLLMVIDIWAVVISHRYGTARTYDNPFYRIIEFVCGIIIADINIEYNNRWIQILRTKLMLLCSVIMLIVGASLMHHYCTYGDYMIYNVLMLPCAAVMLMSLGTIRTPNEVLDIVAYIGKISYPFFLVQFFAWPLTRKITDLIGNDNNILRIAISFTICCVTSIVMYEAIQRPMTKILKKQML